MHIELSAELPWSRLCAFIAEKMGLHFPSERRTDLERGLTNAAAEFGFRDVAAYTTWLLSAPLTRAQLHTLACHLTIGETYFFREHNTFDAFATQILPELIQRRRAEGRKRLRLWSAACCTGEEPYSLAILLQQLLPDFEEWNVSILATDINERFLQKAVAGVYGEWSLRTASPQFKTDYFTPAAQNRFALKPHIRQCVTFAHLNLAEDSFPSLVNDTQAMDVIFCRNVLIYFTAAHMRKLVDNLHRSLVDGGWLAVSPSESSQVVFSRFATVNFPGAVLYRKTAQAAQAPTPRAPILSPPSERILLSSELPAPWMPAATPKAPVEIAPTPAEIPATNEAASSLSQATALYNEGRYTEAADLLLTLFASQPAPTESAAFSLLAHSLANQGRLRTAVEWCERWIATDKLNIVAHYLRAVVLQELGEHGGARRSLQQVLYLEPQFVLAHFALGNLARSENAMAEANKHFGNALQLLRALPSHELLPQSDGLTAGRLEEIIGALMVLTQPHGAAA